jgi:hypothetical protein
LNVLNAIKTRDTKVRMDMDAVDMAVLVQAARDALIAHIEKCEICT